MRVHHWKSVKDNIYMYINICVCVHTHRVEYYAAIEKEILPFETTWWDLEGIMLM